MTGESTGIADRKPSRGRRFEESVIGQAALSVVAVVLVLTSVVWNLPDSYLKGVLTPTIAPLAAITGMQQNWQMYAPDPISRLEHLEVQVRMADGTARVWNWQPGDKVVGPFSWYRWQKLEEQVIRNPESQADLALWAVRRVTDPGEHPAHVDLVFQHRQLPAPGADTPGDLVSDTLYSSDLSGRP